MEKATNQHACIPHFGKAGTRYCYWDWPCCWGKSTGCHHWRCWASNCKRRQGLAPCHRGQQRFLHWTLAIERSILIMPTRKEIGIWGSVTANIGWYVVSILHDQPSCNINITWPLESRYGSSECKLFLVGFRPELLFSILVSILHDWHFM